MDRIPHLSRIEMLILELLVAKGEMYGLEMIRKSKGKLKRGTIYVMLNRMEEKGYVESRKEELPEGAAGAPRRVYKATGHGARVLNALGLASRALAEGMV